MSAHGSIVHNSYHIIAAVCEAWTNKDQAKRQADIIVMALAQHHLLRNAKVLHGIVCEDETKQD